MRPVRVRKLCVPSCARTRQNRPRLSHNASGFQALPDVGKLRRRRSRMFSDTCAEYRRDAALNHPHDSSSAAQSSFSSTTSASSCLWAATNDPGSRTLDAVQRHRRARDAEANRRAHAILGAGICEAARRVPAPWVVARGQFGQHHAALLEPRRTCSHTARRRTRNHAAHFAHEKLDPSRPRNSHSSEPQVPPWR